MLNQSLVILVTCLCMVLGLIATILVGKVLLVQTSIHI
jgi:hypothetical protein